MATFAVCLLVTIAAYFVNVCRRRVGPDLRIFDGRVLRAAVSPPRSLGQLFVQLAGVFGVYRFVYIMFVQPLADREIWQEYLGYPGGIATAWLFYCLMFLPFLLVYLKCAYHFCREGESV